MRHRRVSRPFAVALVGLLLAAAAPASAQSLAERIAAVQRQRQAGPPRTVAVHRAILRKLLRTPVTTGFEGASAGDALRFLAVRLDVPLAIRSRDDRAGYGLDVRTVIDVPEAERSALALLEAILEQCGEPDPCTWQLRRGMLEVGTLDRLAVTAAQTTRVYPIDDLLFEPTHFDDAPVLGIVLTDPYGYGGSVGPGGTSGGVIIPGGGASGGQPRSAARGGNGLGNRGQRAEQIVELITTTVDPDGWVRNGGDRASIRVIDRALVVRGPDYVHRAIGGYATLLR